MPALGLVVGGDAIYGHYYQFLGESNTTALQNQWLAALDKIAALKPRVVVPGHMKPEEGYGVEHLHETREYILVWQKEVAKANSREELVEAMKRLYPNRGGEFILPLSTSLYSNLSD